MAFLEKISKKVSEAAQIAAKKSSELVEVTKLNSNISSEENVIKELYRDMGKAVYQMFSAGNEILPELNDTCIEIKDREKTIEDLKQKILEIKNVRLCGQCGTELKKETAFCPNCGTKQEPIKEEKKSEENPKQEEKAVRVCESCGSPIGGDSAFCSNCGAKT